MLNKTALFMVLLPAALGCAIVSCGGSGPTAPAHFTDPSLPPGVINNGGNGGGGTGDGAPPLARLLDSQPIVGASPNAPLGTNPAYNVHEVTPVTSPVMGASSLAGQQWLLGKGVRVVGGPGDEGTVEDVTVALNGEQPNWDAGPETLVFEEGQTITLWAQYDVTPGATLDRSFNLPETEMLLEDQVVSEDGGVQIVQLDYLLPYLPGGTDTSATFNFSVTVEGGSGTSGSVIFTIVDVPTVQAEPQSWQMAWETQLVQADYDYNDLIVRMTAQETLDTDTNKVVQIDVIVKALARGEGYSADWEFNLEDSFPGAEVVTSTTQLFKAGGTIPDGPTRTWSSSMGICIPVFTPVKNVLPSPPGGGSTVNTLLGTDWRAGGLAKIRIIPDPPMEPGAYQPLPWTNQMLILTEDRSEVYVISLRTNRGGNKAGDDPHPLGFILPVDSPAYSWPLEGRDIAFSYSRFDAWVNWWNDLSDPSPEPKWWEDAPVPETSGMYNVYSQTSDRTGPSNIAGGPGLPIPD